MHNQPREPQHYEDCQAKSIQVFGWTSQGMDWGWGQGIKSTTHRRVEEFGYSCRQRRLTWAKRRRTGLLPSGPKSSFQMRASFVIHLETKVLESGGRVEKLIAQALKSSVKFPQSVMIWGAMSSAGVGPLCFLKPQHFMLPSADQIFKDADFIFQQDLAPAHAAKSTRRWLNDHVLVCLTLQQTHQIWT